MSVHATTWVWDNAEVSGSDLLVLLAIADAANREGSESCQSVATLSRMARVSESTVHRSLRTLLEAGLVEVTGTSGRYRTNIYRLPGMGATPVTGDTCQIDTPVISTPRPLSPVTPNPTTTPSPEVIPTAEVQVVRRPRSTSRETPVALPDDWYPAQRYIDYLRYRTHGTGVTVENSYDRFVSFHRRRSSPQRSTNWDEEFVAWVAQDITRWRQENEQEQPVFDDLGIRHTVTPEERARNRALIEEQRKRIAALEAAEREKSV